MARPEPTLIVNPRSDVEFVGWAHEILAEIEVRAAPDSMQERLRERYPDAIVRSRELSGEETDVWYVYRDGRWMPDGSNVPPEGERYR